MNKSQLLELSSNQDITPETKALLAFGLGSARLIQKDSYPSCG